MAVPSSVKSFPFKSTFIDHEIVIRAFELLVKLNPNPTLIDQAKKPFALIFGIPENWYLFKSGTSQQYVIFYDNKDYYDTMDFVADMFTERQRLSASKGDQSILDLWKNKSFRQSIYSESLNLFKNTDARSLRETIYHTKGSLECTQFKPWLATRLIKWLHEFSDTQSYSVLDPSAGWGDRLIGAMACSSDFSVNYTAYDPNTTLKTGHNKIIKSFNEYLQTIDAKKCSCKIHYRGYETMTPQDIPDNSIDLVFTSPPFFDFEIYTTETDPNQSITQYPTFNEWFVNFLIKVVIQSSIRTLKSGGFLAIHISDVNKLKICEPMILFVMVLFKDLSYYGPVFTVSHSKVPKPRPIWIFRKEPNKTTNYPDGAFDIVLKNKYPELFKLL
jgi:hypothetical protein